MRFQKKWLIIPIILLTVVVAALIILSRLNRYQRDGVLTLPGLNKAVTVLRDEKGMAYIYAGNHDDAFLAFGFITAQDRLFQMELTRLFAEGRICELVGEKAEALDVRMRTIGFHRQAKRHAGILAPQAKHSLQMYVNGVNAYIKNCKNEHPLEFRLSGIEPGQWDISDTLAIMYLMSWNTSANLDTEIIAQMIIEKIGPDKAKEIFPLNINPDEPLERSASREAFPVPAASYRIAQDSALLSYLQDRPLRMGSNNWAVGHGLTAGKKPIVADDPHLDARILPGPWYPCCLITPEFRMAGVIIPGLPNMVIGRNEHVALGVTNSYGDGQDLYVETIDPRDPGRYLEGVRSLPFKIITERLLIRDRNAPGGKTEKEIKIRYTARGPVISGCMPALKTKKVVTLRWAPFETMGPVLGTEQLMNARSADDIRRALSRFNSMMLNFVFADKKGNIGWIASGKLPIRSQRDGTVPYVVKDGKDNWIGWIPFEKMPQAYNPQKGWLGTCNHMTVKDNYPYYYSSHLSPSYRYRRLMQLMDGKGKKTAGDHWQYQRDATNMMAGEIAPVMARALKNFEDTKELGEILSKWDHVDSPDKAAPTIFQAVYREFALLVFGDRLGEELAGTMLRNWYFWQERLQRMLLEGRSGWFDKAGTKNTEKSRDVLFHKAAQVAAEKLSSSFGRDPEGWRWGRAHTIEYVSPIRREGFGRGIIGDGPYAPAGSGETLNRGIYDFTDPFKVTVSASMRMVADLNDDDKVMAVLAGGVCERIFHPHAKDQLPAFDRGDAVYWWFSDKAIQEHKKSALVLKP
jgi:penicillin amidase